MINNKIVYCDVDNCPNTRPLEVLADGWFEIRHGIPVIYKIQGTPDRADICHVHTEPVLKHLEMLVNELDSILKKVKQ
jgi:hypothetical protein